jgi:hypothetical protein
MHVRAALLLSCVLLGCAKPETNAKKSLTLDLSLAEPEGGAPIAARVDDAPAEYVALARAALDEATRLAKKCDLQKSGYEKTVHYVDWCGVWKDADVPAMRKAAAALEASPLTPETGLAVGFLRRLRFFDEWVGSFTKSGLGYWPNASGTLLYYQDLAMAWNDWQPKNPVPVDVGNTRYVKVDPGPSGHLEWGRCSTGTCIVPK